MTIQWLGGENFYLKTKSLGVKIGEKNQLGDLEIISPGEYEVGNVQVEIIDGIIEVFAESVTVGHIKKGKILSDSELERLNGIDILLVGVGGKEFTETKTALEIINQIEPSVVIPMHAGQMEEFAKAEGIDPKSAKDDLKITKGDLRQDEREVVILNAR